MNTLSSEEMDDVVRAAFGKVSPEDQKAILESAKTLIRNIKKRNPEIKFGLDSALVVLACIGMGINDGRIRFKK